MVTSLEPLLIVCMGGAVMLIEQSALPPFIQLGTWVK